MKSAIYPIIYWELGMIDNLYKLNLSFILLLTGVLIIQKIWEYGILFHRERLFS
ncbi:hypothetical protein [Sporosarcina limicola]|uniref:Uncharacterized protein n=1 Tax=Sporosarcina limicola TaxID=34101 RepID=A0A927RDR9_9BACL|nr:hypothetical protein [Sporosarcina limicola]MBE1555600.1 hypothetical protein [Sporosarcina limicola]